MGFKNRPNLQGEISQVKRQNHPGEMMNKVAIGDKVSTKQMRIVSREVDMVNTGALGDFFNLSLDQL